MRFIPCCTSSPTGAFACCRRPTSPSRPSRAGSSRLSAPPGTFVFQVGEEVASLVDGEAQADAASDPDVVVRTTDATGFYDLFVNRRFDIVEVEGDEALLEQLVEAADLPSPVPA